MNREDIIRIAREADCVHVNLSGDHAKAVERLERFAALVAAAEADRIANESKHIIKRAEARGAAAEREACALIGDGYHDDEANCGDAIRARGQA